MQDSLKTLLAVTAAATLLAGTALAQSTSTSPSAAPAAPPTGGTIAPAISSGPPTTAAAPSASIESAGDADVIGLPVKSSDSVKVGKIDNVLVSADGKVDKVVVAVGGILGIGTKDVMVNWKDLQIDGTQREAQVAMSEAELKNAPPFRRDDAAMDSGRSK